MKQQKDQELTVEVSLYLYLYIYINYIHVIYKYMHTHFFSDTVEGEDRLYLFFGPMFNGS